MRMNSMLIGLTVALLALAAPAIAAPDQMHPIDYGISAGGLATHQGVKDRMLHMVIVADETTELRLLPVDPNGDGHPGGYMPTAKPLVVWRVAAGVAYDRIDPDIRA